MPLKAVMKMINLFLALAAFLAVGAKTLTDGEELLWVSGRACVTFVACWLILGFLTSMLMVVLESGSPGRSKKEQPRTAGRSEKG